jgi:hypothetical protein
MAGKIFHCCIIASLTLNTTMHRLLGGETEKEKERVIGAGDLINLETFEQNTYSALAREKKTLSRTL